MDTTRHMIGRRGFLRQGSLVAGAFVLLGSRQCSPKGPPFGTAPTATSVPSTSGGRTPVPGSGLVASPSLNGLTLFPTDNPWNTDVSQSPVDANSRALIASIGLDTGLHPDFGTVWEDKPIGIPYIVVPGNQPKVPVTFEYDDESDPGPYPIPPDAPIEGGPDADDDRHVLIVDRDNMILYELYDAYPEDGGKRWRAGAGAIFNLRSNDLRPAGWTSADAAGLPILPGLVRYDEVIEQQAIRHALRFTCKRTRHAFVAPARHYASKITDADAPPMGMRVRLKQSFDISGFPPPVQVILQALKTYGMFLADNGANWFITGAHDPRWDDEVLATIKRVKGSNFEVVKMGPLTTQV